MIGGDSLAEVRMTLEEYRELFDQLRRENITLQSTPAVPKKKKRKVSKYQREFGRQLKKVKQRSRKNNGELRSGWTTSREMSTAHRQTKRELK